jgi:hypothetical protein
MPTPAQFVLDLAQLGLHPPGERDALEHEAPVLGLRAAVLEAQEVERLRLALSARLSVAGGEPPELDQPRLVGRELQAELREPVA